MSDMDMKGFERGDEAIFIVKNVKGRKKPLLTLGKGNRIMRIAVFSDEECAERFYKVLQEWFGVEGTE